LNYPVITSGEFKHAGSILSLLGENATMEETEAVSLENFVTEKTPKTFLWHTYTDNAVPLENSLLLAAAMRRHGVNFELHVYPAGCHGLSLANEETAGSNESLLEPSCQSWISLAKTWLSNF
ncbi:MAG TPA: alpha/beta hydrolase, partial [Lachnoclostridium sp.]